MRPADIIGTETGIATDHHILKLEMGEGKRKGRQIARCIANLGLAIDFYQGNVTALGSLAPEVTNGHIHHSLWRHLTFGGGLGDFSFLSFFFLLAYLHGRVLISSEMPLRNKAGQVLQGGKSPGVSRVTQGVNILLHAFHGHVKKYAEQQIDVLTGNRFHQGNIPQF